MRLLILIISLLVTVNAMAQFSSYRQLLIFGNEANMQLVRQQKDLLDKSAEGVKERMIKTTVVEKESPLFKKYKADTNQFTVVLIGKDGFEKYRANKPLQTEQLFSIIDAMPMRRSEMKKNQ